MALLFAKGVVEILPGLYSRYFLARCFLFA
jgi:hypothetical protein